MSSDRYPFREIEVKWQRIWDERKQFRAVEDPGRPKFYCLEMFPYPSGRIHMGHVRNYAIGDVLARFKRMRGFNVLHPMGWDAFGLPAENAAIEHGVQPAIWTHENIDYMRAQFKQLGISYDWERELATCDPSYYKWEQLVFIKMLERGLAYRRRSTVNWCPSCQTVLANEQVENGRCWRCDSEVTPREIDGWFFKITAYAEELLEWCDRLPGWPERVITMQRNWIGRSEGAEFDLPVAGRPDLKIRVFTTRPDTAFGMTYAVLAPEHPLVDSLVTDEAERRAVAEFRAEVARESEIERLAADRPKHGRRLRAKVVNPFNVAEIPLFIADYVLMGYGTGAIMAVPGEDQRDWDFARQHSLPIIETVKRPAGGWARRTAATGSRSTPASSTGSPWPRPSARPSTGSSCAGWAWPRSITACATEASAARGTGARRFRCSTARRTAWCRRTRRTCPAFSRKTCSSPARGARRSRRSPRSSTPRAPGAAARRAARRTPWTPSSSRPGTSCATARRGSIEACSSAALPNTGSRWSSTSVSSSTPCCTCSTRASTRRCCATSAW